MALTRPKYSQIYDSDFKNSARVATTASVTLSGGAPTVVDGVTLVLGDRVLVRSQSTAAQNGIYQVTVLGTGSNGTWVRTLDADTADKLSPGTSLSVEEGTTLAGKLYRMTSTNPITLGSTAITWTDVSGGGGSAGGNNGQIQYNDTNAFGGATYLWYNEVTGTVTANAGVASTTTTSGTFIVTGGVGVSGDLHVGSSMTSRGNLLVFTPSVATADVSSNINGYQITQRIGSTLGALAIGFGTNVTPGGFMTIAASGGKNFIVAGAGRDFYISTSAGVHAVYTTDANGNVILNGTTTSSSTTNGALVVKGGAGISGNIYAAGNIYAVGTNSKYGFTWANSVSSAYTVFNSATNSIDTVFG